jgi:hypothetical protein
MEGSVWLRSATPPASAPLHTCTNPDGCRCLTVMEIAQAGPEPDDVVYIRSLGGVATPQQMAKYEAALEAKRYAQRKDEDKISGASDAVLAAWRLEKTDPDRAVTMYRESLTVFKAGMGTPAREWLPSHVHFTYNRLTMLLVKLGRANEALKELEDHDALRLPPEGSKADLDAMEKRKERLAKKLAT